MHMAENAVWAIMAGGLLSLTMLAAADAMMVRTLGAARNLLLIFSIGMSAVLLSGLPEALFPDLPQRLMMSLKAGFGLLSSALGLQFLGIWTGGAQIDRLVYRITAWGSHCMLIAALAMMLLATLVPVADYPQLLELTALLNAIIVPLALVIGVRASLLGDPLARWLALASTILGVAMGGLYLHALKVEGYGMGTWILTAISALLFMLIVMVLMIVRHRQQRALARLARLETGNDPATGLPTGARLLSEVEHAFWRTGRLRGKCVVVCVYLTNLYELGDSMGRSIDNQILVATAARIRRAAGFRCVVGMYHPRCFMIVFSTEKRRPFDEALVHRIQDLVTQPLQVVGSNDKRQQFQPQVGLAISSVPPEHAQPQEVFDQVEHAAMEHARRQDQTTGPDSLLEFDEHDTTW